MRRRLALFSLLALTLSACGRPGPTPAASGPGDAAFRVLAAEIIADTLRRNPSYATYLGDHRYDDRLEDFSPTAIAETVSAARSFRERLDAVDPGTLSSDAKLDREFLQRQMDTRVIELDLVRPWTRDADRYTSIATDAVFGLMKRTFAPPETRLRAIIARERQIPGLLMQARTNVSAPPRVFTEIALEQLDGVRRFFAGDLPRAFAAVTDAALMADFARTNAAVLAALDDYKRWLERDLLPRSTGEIALGANTYRQYLAASEMIDTPLDDLLRLVEADRAANDAEFVATAKAIDPTRTTDEVFAEITAIHPQVDALLDTTQNTLDALRAFILEKDLATLPDPAPVRVRETPPFMRATSSASMDTPGPFERTTEDAFFYVTLPDPAWSTAEREDFMRQWFYPMIVNVALHEVYPGHFLQFMYVKSFPSDVRKVFSTASNYEGWAHYAEWMMVDRGFRSTDRAYKLAQLQDALLRDVRAIVGIRMHTQGLTIDEATKLFMTLAHQPATVARAEARRSAGDPLYGYYTLGKLAIRKLRTDYATARGSQYSLKDFHDRFMQVGPLPLPLVREAMLGARGSLF